MLADKGDLARKSPTAPSLLDPGVRRASAPPLYIHSHLWSCSVALRPPPTWPSLMRVGAAVLLRGALLRKNRQPRHPCAPHVCSGRQHSGSSPTQTLGHACIDAELGIVIFAPAATKKVEGCAVTFKIETGNQDRQSTLRCTVWQPLCTLASTPDHSGGVGPAWFDQRPSFYFRSPE